MGGAVAYRLRAHVRRRWRSVLGLSLLVAVLGGVVLATAAGSRRTASAYDRLLDVVDPPELLVSPPGGAGADPAPFYEAVAEAPGVDGIRLFAGMPLVAEAGTPSERFADELAGTGVLAPLDDASFASGVGRPHLVAGRMPDAERLEEVLVSERLATSADLHVGDHIDAVMLTGAETDFLEGAAPAELGDPIRLIVTGIGVMFDEVVPLSDLSSSGSIFGTPPLSARADRQDWNFEGAFVDVAPGSDLDALTTAIEELGRQAELGTGGPVFVSDQAAALRRANDAMRPLAVALAVAALAIGMVAVLVVGQAVSRSTREAPGEVEALRAIGARPSDRVAFALARAAFVGTLGAVGAVAVAVGLSGRFPMGVARVAEPDPGLRLDGAVLAIGAVLVVVLTTASAVPAALLRLRRRTDAHRPSGLVGAAAACGLPPAAVQGVRFTSIGRGSHPVPMLSTLFAVTAASAAVLATVSFSASLVALIDTPSRYGQGWDRLVDAQFGPAPVQRVVDRLEGREEVTGIAAGNYGDITVDGVPVPAFDLQPVRGSVSVSIVDGEPPAADDEIVLGAETADRIAAEIGDTVDVDTGDGARSMRLTGVGVFPQMGQGSFSTTGLGVGAQLGGGTLDFFGFSGEVTPAYELDGQRYNFVAVDVVGSPSSVDAELVEIEEAGRADGAFVIVRDEQPPSKILDLDRVRVVPGAMAGVLGLIAAAALAHLLVTSVRERRSDLALLRALGFSGRQLYASVSWHASVIAVTALAVGAPLGVALGRAIWLWFAKDLDVSAPAETPWVWLVVALGAALALTNAVAAVPGRTAARTRPAVVLRSE